jgi:hypothetical protein
MSQEKEGFECRDENNFPINSGRCINSCRRALASAIAGPAECQRGFCAADLRAIDPALWGCYGAEKSNRRSFDSLRSLREKQPQILRLAALAQDDSSIFSGSLRMTACVLRSLKMTALRRCNALGLDQSSLRFKFR